MPRERAREVASSDAERSKPSKKEGKRQEGTKKGGLSKKRRAWLRILEEVSDDESKIPPLSGTRKVDEVFVQEAEEGDSTREFPDLFRHQVVPAGLKGASSPKTRKNQPRGVRGYSEEQIGRFRAALQKREARESEMLEQQRSSTEQPALQRPQIFYGDPDEALREIAETGTTDKLWQPPEQEDVAKA